MSFQALTAAEVLPEEPTKTELFDKIRQSLDDLNSRLTVAEGSSNTFPPIDFSIQGKLDSNFVQDYVTPPYRAPRNITLLAARLQIRQAGSAGSLTVDVKRRTSGGSWDSILSAPLTLAFGAGDFALVSGILAISDILQGELIRVDLQACQTDMKDFSVYLEYQGA